VSRSRLLTLLILGGAGLFALVGGEYGTFDWLELRSQERQETGLIGSLQTEVDSLRRFARRLETDPKLVERVARENFGMIRRGEFLYRLESDSLDGHERR